MLRIQNLSVFFHRRNLLHSVSLDIEPGSIFSIAGPNGAGKSTLLRTLVGLIPHQEGSLTFQDRNISLYSPQKRAQLIAYLPQTMTGNLDYRVEDVIAFGNYPWRDLNDPIDVQRRIESAMTMCQVDEFRNRRLATLSGGERQRVFLAQSIVQNTPVILLDEPTVFLDPKHQILFENILKQLQKENKTILYVSHDLHSTNRIADYVAALKNGQILFQGIPKTVLTVARIAQLFDADSDVIQRWYGDSIMNGELF